MDTEGVIPEKLINRDQVDPLIFLPADNVQDLQI